MKGRNEQRTEIRERGERKGTGTFAKVTIVDDSS